VRAIHCRSEVRAWLLCATFVALATLASACTEPDVRRPAFLSLVSGNAQEGEVGAQLSALVEVQVTDSVGRTVPHAVVHFEETSAAGAGFSAGVVPESVESNAGGGVAVRWTLGTRAGLHTLRAWIGPSATAPMSEVEVRATARPGPAVSIRPAGPALVAITIGDSVRFDVPAFDRFGNSTTLNENPVWNVGNSAVAFISRVDVPPDRAAVVVAKAGGATTLQVRDVTAGTLSFEIRTYIGPGRDIAFTSFTDEARLTPGIYVLTANGASTTLLTPQYASDPAWSPDGRQIAFTGRVGFSSAVFVMNADGSGLRALTDTSTLRSAAQPAWSPDGQKIAFVALSHDPNDLTLTREFNAVFVMNADGSAPTRVVFPDFSLCGTGVCSGAQRPTWSPDGTRIAYAFRMVTLSRTALGALFIVNADGSGLRQLPTGDALTTFSSEPAWSPDGERIAFQRSPMRTAPVDIGSPDVYAIAADGTGLTRISIESGSGSPAWSPDSRIAFAMSGGPFGGGLYVMNADGSEARRVANRPGGASRPAWRPGP
jgi:Tol biopolymer transport system component